MAKKLIHRVDELRRYYGLSLNAFDKKVGLSNGYIGRQIKNEANLGSHVVEKIYSTFRDVSGDWLLGEDVPMLKKDHLVSLKEPGTTYKIDLQKSEILDFIQKPEVKDIIEKIVEEKLTQHFRK